MMYEHDMGRRGYSMTGICRNPGRLVGSGAWRYANMTDNREKIRKEMQELSEQVQRDYIELIRLFPQNQREEREIMQNHLSSEVID